MEPTAIVLPSCTMMPGEMPPPEIPKAENPTDATPLPRRGVRSVRVWPILIVVPTALFLSETLGTTAMHAGELFTSGGVAARQAGVWYGGTAAGQVLWILGAEAGLLVTAVVAALCSSEGVLKRLNLGPSRIADWGYVAIGLGTFFVASVSSVVILGVMRADRTGMETGQQAVAGATASMGLLLTVVGGVLPGVAEETLFRGYVQSRLVTWRWLGTWGGIAVAALGFGLMHRYPTYIVMAAVMGLWLGFVARRAGSIRPAIFAHVVHNVLAAGLGVIMERGGEEGGSWSVLGAWGNVIGLGYWGVLLGGFVAAVWVLCRPSGGVKEVGHG